MSISFSELEAVGLDVHSELEVEDSVFLKSTDFLCRTNGVDLDLDVFCKETHYSRNDKQSKHRQKRYRPIHFESVQSPPQKRPTKAAFEMNVKRPAISCCVSRSTSAAQSMANKPRPTVVSLAKRTAPWQKKKPKDSCFVVKSKEMKMFFKLTDDEVIRHFLYNDSCCRVADKYLLAMVFAYFKRADLSVWEYTRMNFFISLYLANDVEEDEEETKYEIFPWALGKKWKDKYPSFLQKRDRLLRLINYKAIVSRRCSDEIMAIEPSHPLWKRERPQHHAGAIRSYTKDSDDDGYPRGPDVSPRYCHLCDTQDSQYDSASPSSTTWCIASSGLTPELQDDTSIWMRGIVEEHGHASSFDMKGLKKTLPANDVPYPCIEE